MRAPRVRLWWLIVAVAAVALATWVIRMGFLSQEYHSRFIEMGVKAGESDLQADIHGANGDARLAAWYSRVARHYLALTRKYERAARQPWLPVAPDPPPPD